MGTIKGGGNVVDSAVAKLQAGWQLRANQINLDYGDLITIAAPANELFYTGRVQQLPACPACFVMEGPTSFKEEGAHNLMSEMDLLVYIFDEDFDGPRLAKRLQRQTRAVIETIYDDEPREKLSSVGPFIADATQSVYRIRPFRTIPGTVFQPDAGDQWRAFYIVVFRACQYEGPS